ncbi:MAG: hypothetical protein KAJ73_00735 [Zetaproteobacteria bacterium]|nr:hypothetical protein [Zetaproteobacteria bacterium]
MTNIKCPYSYTARSRKAMTEFLTGIGGHCDHDNYPLAFNVKAHGVDLSFDHLWKKYHVEGSGEMAPKPSDLTFQGGLEYRKLCKEQYDQHEDYLFEWGSDGARMGITDGDSYRMLWNGKLANVKFGFIGRQGGWLVIEEFEGYSLSGVYNSDFPEFLAELTFKELRLLYRLAVQWVVDLGGDVASREIEYQAAFSLFVNLVEPEWQDIEDNYKDLDLPGVTTSQEEVMESEAAG